MKDYINFHENAQALMQAYTTIQSIARVQNNPHNYVCRWFRKQFPDYRDVPVVINGKIPAVPLIGVPTEEKQFTHLEAA